VVRKRVMSAPVSAMMTSAVVWPTPGMVTSCAHARLEVLLADIQPSTPLVQQLHETPPADDGTAGHALRRDHRAKESGPRAHGNNRQFLSVAPSAILTHELQSITDTTASRTNATPFPASTAAPATDWNRESCTRVRHRLLCERPCG
jgi:hypothetical protein